MRERLRMEIIVENAGEYLVTGNRRIGEGDSCGHFFGDGDHKGDGGRGPSLSEEGAKVLGFIDTPEAALADGGCMHFLPEE